MLKSFKLRLLLVIMLVAITGLIMQSGHSSRQVVEPVLQYIMETDYPVEKTLGRLFDRQIAPGIPIQSPELLRVPCKFIEVEKQYGWYWSPEEEKQQFCPGVYLKVKEDTLVRPILQGQVSKVDPDKKSEGQILIKHGDELISLYGGLDEVLVQEGDKVQTDTILGKTGSRMYFEIRTGEGPVDPYSIFQ